MLLPLPNLDDRRWSDLVEEGRAIIPVYDTGWTDHNLHDPGVMLVELLAWLAEMDIYWLNRVPDSRVSKFLALAGIQPAPPQVARGMLQVLLKAPNLVTPPQPVSLPLGFCFEGRDSTGQSMLFRALNSLTAVPGHLVALQRQQGSAWTDLNRWRERGQAFTPFGDDPQPGAALYLGFDRTLPVGAPVTLAFTFDGERTGWEERRALLDEQRRAQAGCPSLSGPCPDPETSASQPADSDSAETLLSARFTHPSVGLVWEYLDGQNAWQPLDAPGAVDDNTRCLTLDGWVTLILPAEMNYTLLGQGRQSYYALRVRLVSGQYDAAPRIGALAFNGVWVEQSAAMDVLSWMITSQAEITGPPPAPGQPAGFNAWFDPSGWIKRLEFVPGGPPGFPLLSFQKPQLGAPGRLVIEAQTLDVGDGRPNQMRWLSHPQVQMESLALWTWEDGGWLRWEPGDLDSAGRADARCAVDPTSGALSFGDGQRGRVLAFGALPLAGFRSTRAGGGNLPAGAIRALADTSHNRALVGSLVPLNARIDQITNPQPTGSGTAAETLDQARARALTVLAQTTRAITISDTQALACETPGVRLARAEAFANRHPAFPCTATPGVITLVVLPFLPKAQPKPSAGTLNAVRAYISRRRVIGTRIEVIGPRYAPVTVQAQVQADIGVNLPGVQSRVTDALNRFFDPLQGGPGGEGWPLGRDVYRSEVLQVIDETPGVQHVLSLEMIGADGQPSCGNLCLGEYTLPAAGTHIITVLPAQKGGV